MTLASPKVSEKLSALLGSALLLGGSSAFAQPIERPPSAGHAITTSARPAAVHDYVSALKDECKRVGAEPFERPGLLTWIDLTADGLPDYLVDVGRMECQGAYTLWSGAHGGTPVLVFVSRLDGTAFESFNQRAFGVGLGKTREGARIYVDVGGELCGQDMTDVALSEAWSCRRPLDWQPQTQTFDFAPPDQISRQRR